MARLKSDFVVSAMLRRVFSMGGFAAIEHRGATDAGAIFIRQRFRDGTETLYGPAPQSMLSDDEDDVARRFEIRLERADADDAAALLAREVKFDSDLWIVELEIDTIGDLIDLA